MPIAWWTWRVCSPDSRRVRGAVPAIPTASAMSAGSAAPAAREATLHVDDDTRDLIIAQQAHRIRELEDRIRAIEGHLGGIGGMCAPVYHDGDSAADGAHRALQAA